MCQTCGAEVAFKAGMSRWGLLAILSALLACSASEEGVVAAESNLTTPTRVGTVESVALPLTEVSGLGQRTINGNKQFMAVGDAATKLVTFSIASTGRVSTIAEHDLGGLFRGESQWEGVAGDSTGRVFLLTESIDTIHVLDKELRSIIHEIKLTIPSDHPLRSAWAEDENSRGEGMVLLANGHVLIAKEKHPPALVEFVPRGAAPEGYRADLALGDRPYPLASGGRSQLYASKYWLLKNNDAEWLTDISDLAIDHENRLLLLSDQGRAIARIERTLDPIEAKIDVKAIWSLPSSVQKPEGLAFAGGLPFVAVDRKRATDDCLFEVEALP